MAQATGAIPYDIPGVETSHVGELCSFDAFLKKYRLNDPALKQMAVIVRESESGARHPKVSFLRFLVFYRFGLFRPPQPGFAALLV